MRGRINRAENVGAITWFGGLRLLSESVVWKVIKNLPTVKVGESCTAVLLLKSQRPPFGIQNFGYPRSTSQDNDCIKHRDSTSWGH